MEIQDSERRAKCVSSEKKNFHFQSERDYMRAVFPLISAAPLGIHIEISASPLNKHRTSTCDTD